MEESAWIYYPFFFFWHSAWISCCNNLFLFSPVSFVCVCLSSFVYVLYRRYLNQDGMEWNGLGLPDFVSFTFVTSPLLFHSHSPPLNPA